MTSERANGRPDAQSLQAVLARTDRGGLRLLAAAASLAGAGPIEDEHLRRALDSTEETGPAVPPGSFKLGPAAQRVLQLADQAATRHGAAAIGLEHLRLALLEEQARAVGLDLNRLRSARAWVARRYASPPSRRVVAVAVQDGDQNNNPQEASA